MTAEQEIANIQKSLQSPTKSKDDLAEKLRVLKEQLDASEGLLSNADQILDVLIMLSKQHLAHETMLYKKLTEILPKILAEVKEQ